MNSLSNDHHLAATSWMYTAQFLFHQSPTRHSDYIVTGHWGYSMSILSLSLSLSLPLPLSLSLSLSPLSLALSPLFSSLSPSPSLQYENDYISVTTGPNMLKLVSVDS